MNKKIAALLAIMAIAATSVVPVAMAEAGDASLTVSGAGAAVLTVPSTFTLDAVNVNTLAGAGDDDVTTAFTDTNTVSVVDGRGGNDGFTVTVQEATGAVFTGATTAHTFDASLRAHIDTGEALNAGSNAVVAEETQTVAATLLDDTGFTLYKNGDTLATNPQPYLNIDLPLVLTYNLPENIFADTYTQSVTFTLDQSGE